MSAGPPRAAVLCLAFNRPDCFAELAEALRGGGERPIFVAIDGPRANRPADAQACAQVRARAQRIDCGRPLQVRALEQNLGCGPAVTAAIDWAFEQVDALIILEDDCIPDPSFFAFCDDMLQRYRDDTRVMQIGGSNWGAARERFAGASYAYTAFAPVWGWATWRRAWSLYDYKLDSWPRVRDSGLAAGMSVTPRFRRMLEREWDIVRAGGGTWDHQWQYAVLRHHGLNICPSRNLIRNIGFDDAGTQLRQADRILSQVPLGALDSPYVHPPEVARSASVESVFEAVYWQKFGWPADLYRALTRLPFVGAGIRWLAHRVVRRPS